MLIFDQGKVSLSDDWATVHDSFVRSILSVHHPNGSGRLILRRKVRKPNGQWQRNGVGYLKKQFLQNMREVEGWQPETDTAINRKSFKSKLFPSLDDYDEPITSKFGGFDFVTSAPEGTRVAIEWETGNISSSHRSLNKLSIALAEGVIQAGVIIVPSRALYEHLTDRIGNIHELSCYLSMWSSLGQSIHKGLLAVTVVEHDELTDDAGVEYLKVGDDGRALQGRSRP